MVRITGVGGTMGPKSFSLSLSQQHTRRILCRVSGLFFFEGYMGFCLSVLPFAGFFVLHRFMVF